MSKEILNPILTEFDKLSDDALLTLRDVINMPERSKNCPATRGLLPISRHAWYSGIKDGRYPKPIKLGSGNYWRAGDIRRLINGSKSATKTNGDRDHDDHQTEGDTPLLP